MKFLISAASVVAMLSGGVYLFNAPNPAMAETAGDQSSDPRDWSPSKVESMKRLCESLTLLIETRAEQRESSEMYDEWVQECIDLYAALES